MDAIAKSLKKRGIDLVCHMTPCDRLPSILAHGGILSLHERAAQGIEESDDAHYWGSADKQEAFSHYVIASFMPAWWMCRAREEELAIILLDSAVCSTPGTLFCPGNSAYNKFPADEVLTWTGVDSLDTCFPNPDSYQAGASEIFVPKSIPLSHFRVILFPDKEAAEYWVTRLDEQPMPDVSPPPVKVKPRVRHHGPFRFPDDYTPTNRIRP